MKRWGFILAISALLALAAAPAAAQSKSVEVPRRDAEITILPNGDVQVVETWEVKFMGGPFTTAYRSIPLNKVDRIDNWSVADEEHQYREVDKGSNKAPYTFEYTSGDGNTKATWSFPATTDQTRTFKVGYMLHGALRIDAAGDEFYWKFIEADRQYPIRASRVAVHLPQGFKTEQLKATTYRNGAENAGARVVDERTIEFTGKSFPGGTEWEIRARFPHGVVKTNPPGWQVTGQQKSPAPPVDQAYLERFQRETTIRNLALGATVVAGIGSIIWLRRLNRRNAVKPARLAGILLIPGAVYTAVSLVLGSLFWGSVCLVTFLAGFFTLLVATISVPASGGGSTSWGSGGDWSGGDFGGSGSDGGGGGSSGFD